MVANVVSSQTKYEEGEEDEYIIHILNIHMYSDDEKSSTCVHYMRDKGVDTYNLRLQK